MSERTPFTVDRGLVRELKNREDARFYAARPRSAELWERGQKVMPNGVPMAWHRGSYHHLPLWIAEGKGARFTDVDGHSYCDFNIADMSMFCGYAPEPLVRAVSQRMAKGNQFLLPTEDAILVSEELGRRYGLPKWQYTLSATQANTEAIRVARVVTGYVAGEVSSGMKSYLPWTPLPPHLARLQKSRPRHFVEIHAIRWINVLWLGLLIYLRPFETLVFLRSAITLLPIVACLLMNLTDHLPSELTHPPLNPEHDLAPPS